MRRALIATCITMALCGAGAANADAKQSRSAVSISHAYEAAHTLACGHEFNYAQRMTVQGEPSSWVPVEFVARPGRFGMMLAETCEGYDIYVLDTSCGCQLLALPS